MKESDIGNGLLNLDRDLAVDIAQDRQLARKVYKRNRRRVWLLAVMTFLFWLVAAVCVFFVVYVAIFHLYPKQQQLMRDSATGKIPAERLSEIQSLHFRVVEICTLVVATAFVAATLAVACTVLLVLASRHATMHHINANLVEIFARLNNRDLT